MMSQFIFLYVQKNVHPLMYNKNIGSDDEGGKEMNKIGETYSNNKSDRKAIRKLVNRVVICYDSDELENRTAIRDRKNLIENGISAYKVNLSD